MSQNYSLGGPRSYEGTWEKLSQVAVKGAEYDSRERQPHPKCLQGTRVSLLDQIHRLLDSREQNRLIWLHGMAGVGKSAIAFSIAERMRALRVQEQVVSEKRLLGSFFFSRKHGKRCTTGYFFATLAYQLAINFPNIREDVNKAIRDNPALLDPDKSLRDQMEELFLQPLRRLRYRLCQCSPSVFVVDALDECIATEVADLISLLGQALREPGLPVIHILFTSRSEEHIHKAIQNEDMHALVCEIPVNTSGTGVAATISVDDANVDNDIHIYLEHSFRQLQGRHPDFPQPPRHQLARLASRAGRRFIVASTMMKFINDEDYDPRDRLQLMLELTSDLLPGAEVYKLYDQILSTCADPKRAYIHLSIVATLVDPLPISQISKLLGPTQGRDVETTLAQLRSVMDIPTDSNLPINIHHSSVRDYVSDPSNCGLLQMQPINPPHTLLAHSSFRLMMQDIPKSDALLDALSGLKRHSRAISSDDPLSLKDSLAFIVQPPEPLHILSGMLWLRGYRSSDLQPWLETLDGRAWLQTQGGRDWLHTCGREGWLHTQGGRDWLRTPNGREWLQTVSGRDWLRSPRGRDWLNASAGREWLQTRSGRDWLQTRSGRDWIKTRSGRYWLQTQGGRDWLQTPRVRSWLQTRDGRDWLTGSGQNWLQTRSGKGWLQTRGGWAWLQTQSGREWLQKHGGRDWLQTQSGRNWLRTSSGQDWLLTPTRPDWLQTRGGQDWLQTQNGRHWLRTSRGASWLQSRGGQDWLQTEGGGDWLQIRGGQDWLQTRNGCDWLQESGGRCWLQSRKGRYWLPTEAGKNWLHIQAGRDWLQTSSGRDWLQTLDGQAWRSTPAASVWVAMEEFSSMFKAINDYIIDPEMPLLPAFEVIQHFKNLPDFLMFPAFLALRQQTCATSAAHFTPDVEIIHAMMAFASFADGARGRSQSASDALKYACQNWAFHLSRAPHPWDNMLNHLFKSFWNCHLLSWLERQWCLTDLPSYLLVLSEGQRLAKENLLQTPRSSHSRA
ncbi:hypothetical protein BDR06DRAFT_685210 [Suillus hirtellus]|nr:hypothetical protein BDR06DRAFT_685210 [Suillus hirtellus]